MADYFTSDHVELLNTWKGTVYDKSNPEQQKIYDELSAAPPGWSLRFLQQMRAHVSMLPTPTMAAASPARSCATTRAEPCAGAPA
jgi:hypothetical protein